MKAWAVTVPGQPLKEVEVPTPSPKGSEVLLEVTHCGVCHSDVHFWKGEYDLGGGNVLKITDRGVTLPRAPGHEIVGRVLECGPDVTGVAVGDVRAIYPWVGCGKCESCRLEQDNLCTNQRSLGVIEHGGFASHVVVPHSRYLVDPGDVDLALASTYSCSGITAYSAIKKLMPYDADKAIVLIGAGGLGLSAIAMLRAMGHNNIVSVDNNPEKEKAAMEEGASAFVAISSEHAKDRILAKTGGPVMGVLDFVNSTDTARTGFDLLDKGGKLILVGVAGGQITLSQAGMVFRANAIEGSLTGSVQDLRDVIALANEGKLRPIPIQEMAKEKANEALGLLRDGQVNGRIVLVG